MQAVYETHLPMPSRRSGKVRDIYDIIGDAGDEVDELGKLLIVATDRVSAFDVVLPTPIPGKGRLLTDIAAHWLRWIEQRGLARTHLLSTDASEASGLSAEDRRLIEGRIMLARRCRVVPIECVVRGYLAGSGWEDYQRSGGVCGIELPAGLRQGDRLPEPIFTPATKAEQGAHDENITFQHAGEIVGEDLIKKLRDLSLAIYNAGAERARERGVIIADTKFEFGFPEDEASGADAEPMLVDEALTPDSSRFWPAEAWRPGRDQPSFDKQYIRDYLLTLVSQGLWDKSPPGPELPEEIVNNTLARYEQARRRLVD